MRTKILSKMLVGFLCLILALPTLPESFSRMASAQAISSSSFFTSFEKGNPVPSWKNTAETSNSGKVLASGITSAVGGRKINTMRTEVTTGPAHLYASPDKAGWTGSHVLTYSGKVSGRKGSYAFNKLFQVHIPVRSDTQLSYFVAPISDAKNQLADASAYISVDLAFSDGTYLHQLRKATDEDGIQMTPSAQGSSGTLMPDQWNHKQSDIGQVAAGKTITRILIAYSAPETGISFQGAIDDIEIGSSAKTISGSTPVDEVNILRGTASNNSFPRGETVPAVGVPNGFAYWSPALNSSSPNHPYPYRENNDPENSPEIQSFSLSHSPNDQNGDRQSFQVMPSDLAGTPAANRLNRGLAFSHKNETAKPDEYSVTFNNGMKAELTALSHSAILRFTFKGNSGNLIFDNIDNNGGLTLNPSKNTIEGYSDVQNGTTGNSSRLFFYGYTDSAVTDSGRLYGEGRDKVTAFYKFDTSKQKTVTLRIATSLISIEQAQKNLSQEISDKTSFETVMNEAKDAWNKQLSKVTVQGASPVQRTTLYSNLYRLFLYPNAGFENTGTDKKPDYSYAAIGGAPQSDNTQDSTGASIKQGKIYVNSDFAYSAQTVWPAYSLLDPNLAGQMVNGFLTNEENGGGSIAPSEIPYADEAFADTYLRGAQGINTDELYSTLLQDATVADDGEGETTSSSSESGGSLDSILADSLRDFSLANLASKLAGQGAKGENYSDESTYFLQRSQSYLNAFDPSADLFNQKTASGKWEQNSSTTGPDRFNPQAAPNRWRFSFDAPQDGQGLANLYGGRGGLGKKINQFLASGPTASALKTSPEARQAAAGKLGMFTLDSPTAPSIPYMYLFAAAPWKTQDTVRNILNRFYTGSDIGQGFLGSDQGSMLSGFYFFGSAGIFPLQKGTADYVLSAPYFSKMTIHLAGGHNLVIRAPGVSNQNRYIQSVTFNGRRLTGVTLTQDQLAGGGTLSFQMGPKPSPWGSKVNSLPDSLTPPSTDGSSFYPKPLVNLIDRSAKEATLSISDGTSPDDLANDGQGIMTIFSSEYPSLNVNFTTGNARIKMYTLSSSSSVRNSDPEDWTLFASNDGKTWDTIDHRSGEIFKWRSMTRPFVIKNPKAYKYYRLDITKTSNSGPLALNGFELLGYTGIGSGFNAIRSKLLDQFGQNTLSETETASLSYALNQAQNAFNTGNISTSIYYLQSYVQLINSFTYDASTPGNIREQLSADAHALIDLLSE
ncbi:GH92 family glycosyl hydrolase [Sporolactobacillus pectinivorans]|uniref:GH92 family glycosyl hydrolase n=1 Tax=Sporolactobacillus pectinivorans TaxID=1591408 RepID=UPI000C25ABA3|nr:GH92 family glycosyl hydrolase [Sporolactobacillus pectinivorans]